MCSQGDHPPYDPPEPVAPRRYVLSGQRPPEPYVPDALAREAGRRLARLSGPADEPRGSVALAVIGEMLSEAEEALERVVIHDGRGVAYERAWSRLDTLREARERIAAAEAKQ